MGGILQWSPTVGGGGLSPPHPSGELCKMQRRKEAFIRASDTLLAQDHRARGYIPLPVCADVGTRLALAESERSRGRAAEAGSWQGTLAQGRWPHNDWEKVGRI